MIRKWYEVSCDGCGIALNHYTFSPTPTRLRQDGIKVRIYNGKKHTYCSECFKQDKKRKENNYGRETESKSVI